MKKLIVISAFLLAFSLVFCGCLSQTTENPNHETEEPNHVTEEPDHETGTPDNVMVIPSNDIIGEPKTFEAEGIKLTLTEKFIEEESELGFYAYYVSNFCGVVVLKEEFSLEEGLADRSLEEYTGNVIANNGHTGIEPQSKDDLWFYVKDSGRTRSYSYSYKGSDAFWIVQFLCMTSDVPILEDLFYLWADCVEVE